MSTTTNTVVVTASSSSLASSQVAASSSLASAISSSISAVVSSEIAQDSTITVEPSTTNIITSIVSGSSLAPTTQVITSVVTQSASSNGVVNTDPVTVIITKTNSGSQTLQTASNPGSATSSAAATSSTPASLSNSGSGNGTATASKGGLGTTGTTAVAVVVPVVVVAALLFAGIFFWRKRKQKKANEDARRKEIADYGYNPNNDPTLPAMASEGGPEMAQDSGNGYRGWGAAAIGSNRNASTTLSGGHTQGQPSESGHSYGQSTTSPEATNSDQHSVDPLVANRRGTMNSDDLGALGAAPVAGSGAIRRGPSNASSAYSNGARSEDSEDVPPMPSNIGQAYDYNPNTAAYSGYGQHGPYGDGSYGGGQDPGMPIVRDVSARRNTQIQNGGGYQQGNSGIAQNF